MENSILTVTVRNKVPSVSFGEYLVSENTGYRIRFDFDREWEAHYVKIAHFDMGGWQYEKQFTGNTVDVPLLPSDITEIKLGVIAGDLTTTSAVTIPVYDSILTGAQPTSTEDAAELARVRAEAERVAAEQARVTAENGRAAAEQQRVNAENARIAAESARASAESTRVSNEATRVANENARISAENARQSAETARQSAETLRAAAEVLRRSEESTRIQNEQNRIAAEELRASAESTRVTNENARISAESSRADAETARRSAETARASAETARAEAETARAAAEAARVQAESERAAAMESFVSAVNAYACANDVFNVPYLISEYGTSEAFRLFAGANAPLDGLTNACLRFFGAASAASGGTYTSQFSRYNSSSSTQGVKKDANAQLVCEPSTNSTAGRDDYSDLPLFACFDCNYTIDAQTLEPVIHAVKGVYGNFSNSPSNSLVGVLQMTGWVKRTSAETTKTVEYAAVKKDSDFKPLPESVRAGSNSVRPFVIHAKYAAGYNSAGKFSSVSGVQPIVARSGSAANGSTSHDAQVTAWREWGSQYAGSSICDAAFCQLMLEIKYAVLGNSAVMKGCCSYSEAEKAAASETGVKRVLLTAQQAAKFPVGCSVSLGTGTQRNDSSSCDVCDAVKVLSVEDVTVGGTALKALNLDAETAFSVTADSTYVVSQPWATGATDAVLGNDGSPYDNLSGIEPFKLQGIELMIGVQEIAADTTFRVSNGTNTVYVNRRAADIRSGSIGENAALIGTVTRASNGWRYIKELHWSNNDPDYYMLPANTGATATTGYCAATMYLAVSTSNSYAYEWIAYGSMLSGDYAGLAYVNMTNRTNYMQQLSGARACGSAGNRGIYSEGNALSD